MAFREGLKSAGFVEGQNVIIEYSSPDGHHERLPALAADLVRREVALIVAMSGDGPLYAVRATTTIPIVFANGGNPVEQGWVKNLARPEGNVTGVTFFSNQLGPKRLELLHELVPAATSVGLLLSSRLSGGTFTTNIRDMQTVGRMIGIQIVLLDAGTEREIDAAFDTITHNRVAALVVQNDADLNARIDQIVALAARHAIPTIYAYREHAMAGGLLSYGTNVSVMYRQAGIYTARILKGEKPADLPVLQPVKFELVVNVNTAKALGLTIPRTIFARAEGDRI
jgi:putative ABC transport system substrate-binding protein